MRRTSLSLPSMLVALLLAAGPRPVHAASADVRAAETESTAAEPSPKVAELQAMHGEAQTRIERYNATHDAADLVAARDLLARWLVEHRALYGDGSQAVAVRAPIEQQLGQIDAELMRVGATSPPPPTVAPPPAAPPPTLRPDQAEDLSTGRGLVAGGTTLLAMGAVTVLAVSLPLWALRNQALRRAEEQTFYVDEQRFVGRARRRQAGAVSTLVVGAVLASGGVAMVTVGAIKRARVRRELSFVPALGPGFAGASATLRF